MFRVTNVIMFCLLLSGCSPGGCSSNGFESDLRLDIQGLSSGELVSAPRNVSLVLSGSDVVQSISVRIDATGAPVFSSPGLNPDELPTTLIVALHPASLATGPHTFDVVVVHGFGFGSIVEESVPFTVP
jgi:hypothetical protein